MWTIQALENAIPFYFRTIISKFHSNDKRFSAPDRYQRQDLMRGGWGMGAQ